MLSLPHLIVLFVVALVIFGPQKLPELARMLGKATAEFRKMTGDFRYQLEEEVRDLERQTRIRDEEVAAALAAQSQPVTPPEETTPKALTDEEVSAISGSPQAPPENTVPRTSTDVEASPTESSEASLQSSPEPAPPSTETVTAPHEKRPDDNAAV